MAGRPTGPRFSDNKGYRSSRELDSVTARNSTSRTRSLDVALGLSACDQSLTGPGRVISLPPPSRQTSVAGPWAPCCSKALSLPHGDRGSRRLVSTARILHLYNGLSASRPWRADAWVQLCLSDCLFPRLASPLPGPPRATGVPDAPKHA